MLLAREASSLPNPLSKSDFGMKAKEMTTRSKELPFTSVYAVALHDLTLNSNPDEEKFGLILHQGPVRKLATEENGDIPKSGSPESADLLAVKLTRSKTLRSSVFVSDVKVIDDATAKKETALYAQVVSKLNNCGKT